MGGGARAWAGMGVWLEGGCAGVNWPRREVISQVASNLAARVEDWCEARGWKEYRQTRGCCKLCAGRRSKLVVEGVFTIRNVSQRTYARTYVRA